MLALGKFIHRETVIELKATTKADAIKELVDISSQAGLVTEPDEFLNKLLERESQSSTGIGLGVAIPHARIERLDEIFVSVGLARKGIDFGSPDGAPVNLVLLIGVNRNQAQYLQLISRVSWLVRNDGLRKQMIQAPTVDDLFKLLSEH